MAWTVDPGLQVLLAQINAAAPGRSKASDGSIGDPAHQAGVSDHNPESPAPPGNPNYEVDARDFTHDPRYAGSDMHQVTEAIRLSRDPRVAYVIWNRRIYSGAAGPSPWMWRPYYGDNPHDKHAHVSVRDVNRGTQPWSISIGGNAMAWEPTPHETINAIVNGSTDKGYVTGKESATTEAGSIRIVATINLRTMDAKLNDVKGKLDQLLARPATVPSEPTAITDEQLERVLRKVLGMTPTPE